MARLFRRFVVGFVVVVSAAAEPVQALPGFASELRGGFGEFSGPEQVRVGYLGDNDGFAPVYDASGFQYDRWFSTGTTALGRWDVEPAQFDFLPSDRRLRLMFNAGIAHAIYTPRDIHVETAAQLGGDRAYGGHLAMTGGFDLLLSARPLITLDRRRRDTTRHLGFHQLSLQLYAGSVGPASAAGTLQTGIHQLERDVAVGADKERFPLPKGWNGASTGSGATFDLSMAGRTTLLGLGWDGGEFLRSRGALPGIAWLVGTRVDVGLQRVAASVDTSLVFGLLGDPMARPFDGSWPLALYGFARAEGRAVAWNAAVQLPADGLQAASGLVPVVGEVSGGIVVRASLLELSYALLYRTNESSTIDRSLQTGQVIGQVSASVVW